MCTASSNLFVFFYFNIRNYTEGLIILNLNRINLCKITNHSRVLANFLTWIWNINYINKVDTPKHSEPVFGLAGLKTSAK